MELVHLGVIESTVARLGGAPIVHKEIENGEQ